MAQVYSLVSIGDVVVPPVTTGAIYIACGTQGLYRGAKTGIFTQVASLTPLIDTVGAVQVIPGTNSVIAVGTLSGVAAVALSTDGGDTWNDVTPSFSIRSLRANSTKVYAYVAANPSGIIYETVDGSTWTKIVPCGPSGSIFSNFAVSDTRIWYGEATTGSGSSTMRYAPIAGGDGTDTLIPGNTSPANVQFGAALNATVYAYVWSMSLGNVPIIKVDNSTFTIMVGTSGFEVTNGLAVSDTGTIIYNQNDTIYRSVDALVTHPSVFTDGNMAGGVIGIAYGKKVAYDPTDPTIWYCIGGEGQGSGSTRFIWISLDDGLNWTAYPIHALGNAVYDISVMAA